MNKLQKAVILLFVSAAIVLALVSIIHFKGGAMCCGLAHSAMLFVVAYGMSKI